ncbi:MAG: hypothetical protein HOH98_06140, partial [Flavobacteriaceae bacterium]|nr:hypothetical protein [Flavobacteriaceae bacterium]
MIYKARKRSKKLDKNELLHRKSSRKLDSRILKRKQFEDSISDEEIFNLKAGALGLGMWSEFVVNIPGRGKVAKAIAHSKILKVRTDEAENKFTSMMKKYNELKIYLVKDLNPIINKLLKYIFTKKNEGLSFNKKSMVSTHKQIYKARNKLYQRLFGIKQKKTANNFLRSVEKTIQLRKVDKVIDNSADIDEESISKTRDTENAKMNVRDMAGYFSRSRNVLALRCSKVFGGKRIECLVKQFRKKEKSYNNALVKFEIAKDKFHTFIDPFVERQSGDSMSKALEDSGRQITLQDEYIPKDFKEKRTDITAIFNDAVNNIYSRVTELNKKMKQFFDEDFPTVGILRYNFTGVKYKSRWSKFLGLPGSYGSKMKRNKQDGESVDGQTKVELDSRASGNLKINRNNFMKIFAKLNDIYDFLNDDRFSVNTIMTSKGENGYKLIYGRFNDIDKLLAKIVGLNTDNIRRICRKDLGALTSSDNYIRGMRKQEDKDVDADPNKTALSQADKSQAGGKQTKANLRKQGIYRQYKLPVFIENRFLSAINTKTDAQDENLSARKFTYSQLGLYKPSVEEGVKIQKEIIIPYSFYSAAIYEPHIFSADDVLFGTLAFILGRENEIIGAEMGTIPNEKIRHESLINSIDKLRIELGVKEQPKFSDNSSKRENRQKMSVVRYYALFFSSVIEYYVYFLKMQIDKFVICNLLNKCLNLDSIPNNNNNENSPNGTSQEAEENIGLNNINQLTGESQAGGDSPSDEGDDKELIVQYLDTLKRSKPEYILNPDTPGSTETDLKRIVDKSTQVVEKDGEISDILANFEPKIQFEDWVAESSSSAPIEITNKDVTIYNELKKSSFKFQGNLPLQPNSIIKSDLDIYLQNRFFVGETKLLDIFNTLSSNTRVFVPGATGDFRFDKNVERQSERDILKGTRQKVSVSSGGATTATTPTTTATATATTTTTTTPPSNKPELKFINRQNKNTERFYQTFADDTKISSNKFANILPKVFFNQQQTNDKKNIYFNEKLLNNKETDYTEYVTNYSSNDLKEFKGLIDKGTKGKKKMRKLAYSFDQENMFYANLETEFFKLMPLLEISGYDLQGKSLETMVEQEVIDEAIERFKLNKEIEKFKEVEKTEKGQIDIIKGEIDKADKKYKDLIRLNIDQHNFKVLEFYQQQVNTFVGQLGQIFKDNPDVRDDIKLEKKNTLYNNRIKWNGEWEFSWKGFIRNRHGLELFIRQ